jgi:hypothetical protein
VKEAIAIPQFKLSEESHSKKSKDSSRTTNKHVGVVCEEKLLGRSEVF